MNRLIFVPYIGAFGGVERLILSLTGYLASKGQRSTVLCFGDTIDLPQHAHHALTVQCLNPRRNSVAEARALRRHFGESTFDPANRPLFFDLKGAFYAGLSGLRGHVLHLTDPPSLLPIESSRDATAFLRWSGNSSSSSLSRRLKGEFVHRINRRGVQNASKVIVMTHRIAEELQALYGVITQIVRPGVAPQKSAIPTAPPSDIRRFRLFSVSRLEQSKRLDEVLLALHKLNQLPPSNVASWEFDIAGSGPSEQNLRELTSRLGIEEKVRFHGRVSDAHLEQLFQQANAFVMPAVQGYGLPALEALIRNVPVILHRDSGVSELLAHTHWAEIISTPDELPDAIVRMKDRIVGGEMADEGSFPSPTDEMWAAQIATACDWKIGP